VKLGHERGKRGKKAVKRKSDPFVIKYRIARV